MSDEFSKNEIRFGHNYIGRPFRGTMPLYSDSEELFSKGTFSVSFGTYTSGVDCRVSDKTGALDLGDDAAWLCGPRVRRLPGSRGTRGRQRNDVTDEDGESRHLKRLLPYSESGQGTAFVATFTSSRKPLPCAYHPFIGSIFKVGSGSI
jgi:hypothetical protein